MSINLIYRNSDSETPPSQTVVKNEPLTSSEMDANFKSISNSFDSIDNDKLSTDDLETTLDNLIKNYSES